MTVSAAEPPDAELEHLRQEVSDLRSALEAIRSGGVDALIVGPAGQEQLYALSTADRPYRLIIEQMGEGAVTLSAAGLVLFANRRLAELLGWEGSALLGRAFQDLVDPSDRARWETAARVPPGSTSRTELTLRGRGGQGLPVLVSVTGLELDAVLVRTVVVSDLSELVAVRSELQEAQRVAGLGSWRWDTGTGLVDWSREMFALYELPVRDGPLELREAIALRAHPDDDTLSQEEVVAAALTQQVPFQLNHRLHLPDRPVRYLSVRAEPVFGPDGAVVAVRGTSQDVTALREAEHALARAAAEFVGAFEHAPVAMAMVGLDGTVLRANGALVELLGGDPAALVGTSFLSSVGEHAHIAEAFRHLLEQDTSVHLNEARIVSSTGAARWVSVLLARVRVDQGGAGYVVAHLQDVSERKSFEDRLRHLADHDSLTGLANRRSFHDRLGQYLGQVERYGATGALVLFDLDHFKHVNDTFGHPAGDALLQEITAALLRRLRDSDVLARLGGDEFAILLCGVDLVAAEAILAQLLTVVRGAGVEIDGRRVAGTASAGLAMLGAGERVSADAILAHADVAMYGAKDAGRDGYEVYDPLSLTTVTSSERHRWLENLRRALAEDSFELAAQPIVSLAEGTVVGCELLLRMREAGELVLPDRFLPIAERHGLAPALDRMVIRRALALVAASTPPDGFRWSLNLSAASLDDPSLPALIESELLASGVDAATLVFEITETSAVKNIDAAKALAGRLSELGCRFALDDFGAGYGSFYYLKHLPCDYLKIDGEFVRDLSTSHPNQVIVQAIVAVATQLGKKTIAEYVGDADTLALLTSYGVDYGQGFHLGRPTPPAQLLAGVAMRGAGS